MVGGDIGQVAMTNEEMVDRLILREGGYVDDPADRGGETKFGLSKRQYPVLDIKALTKEHAKKIYERDYLRGPKIDQIVDTQLREQLFDFAVNSGAPRAVKTLQYLLGVEEDGLLGPVTLKAANSVKRPAALNNQLVDARQAYVDGIVRRNPSQARFERGWRKRIQSFRVAL